ncbi:MAG TPA: hypothetical protein ENK23_06710 [Sorangium sp.]|nr:hypothetical protein [Sorangium sp.]
MTALGVGLLFSSSALAQRPAGSQRAQAPSTAGAQRTPPQARPRRAHPLQTKNTRAQQAVAEVVVLHGTNDGKGIDPSIGKLPQLKQPPFSSYDSYQLLKRSELSLKDGGAAATLTLPDKGRFKLALSGVQASKKHGRKTRYKLRASIVKADGKTFLPNMNVNARAGDIFFIAGQKYKGGILVLGIRVRPKK